MTPYSEVPIDVFFLVNKKNGGDVQHVINSLDEDEETGEIMMALNFDTHCIEYYMNIN